MARESILSKTEIEIAGDNRVELLLFRVGSKQLYGLNVFKLREILYCPKLTVIPDMHPAVKGVAHIRSYKTIPVISLHQVLNGEYLKDAPVTLICEYNRSVVGFLISDVDKIIHTEWSKIEPPPKGLSDKHYLTAVTYTDDKLVEILDVEQILSEIMPPDLSVSEELTAESLKEQTGKHTVLIVEDSRTARRQITSILEKVGVKCITANDGAQAYTLLKEMTATGESINDQLLMVISDIEMPHLDGYSLVKKCREHPQLKELYIVLNTSISGEFNRQKAETVGADKFLAKISGEDLGGIVIEQINNRV
ncbi:chemotaxis protein CheV [Piscirickettsia salmonis]|uniref:chemotaxis protein n=1 Tax=Piscirickettsia salmonis TaxID=1238 RepID=UPI000332C84C|nr:chemotaxis protein [Piscirickettsia salmonis]APS58882.1 response regulator [Piscirickettsia salmonis]ERL60478.1 response regulator [Piscirickettsia salmonis LF-89 = ATCC VR-1361]PEQ15184.1 chemotaxis protein CheV [Piscirickettsia salmonis]